MVEFTDKPADPQNYMPARWKCWRDASHGPIDETMYGWPKCSVCGAAPAYHERPDYLRENFVLGLYVPVDARANATIAPRSGIVGLPDGGDGEDARISVYFEGWLNGPMQYGDRDARGLWEAGVEHAAGRMVTAYPTIAQASLRDDTLKCIGIYRPKGRRFEITDEEALNAWLNT